MAGPIPATLSLGEERSMPRSSVLRSIALLMLGGCVVQPPAPVPPTHPASAAAPEAPIVDAGALLTDQTGKAPDEPAHADGTSGDDQGTHRHVQ
jgi:hypothetical protein